MHIRDLTYTELLELPNLDTIIVEYANTMFNPLVQNIDPQTFIPRVKNAFLQKSKTENIKFNVLTDDENNVKGFLIYTLYVNGNCPDTIADIQSIYVTPEFRKNGGSTRLLNYSFQKAKSYGARGIYLSAPYGSRLSKDLERFFRPVYVNFFKEL